MSEKSVLLRRTQLLASLSIVLRNYDEDIEMETYNNFKKKNGYRKLHHPDQSSKRLHHFQI